MWQAMLAMLCLRVNAETHQKDEKHLVVIAPKELGRTEKKLMKDCLPEELSLEFVVGPKFRTMETLCRGYRDTDTESRVWYY